MVKSDLPDRLRSTAGYLIKLIVSSRRNGGIALAEIAPRAAD